MSKYPFLSQEWIEEARKVREELGSGAAGPAIKMNQIITDVPFGEGTIHSHMDSSNGTMEVELGHIDDPEVTVTLDYGTAKAIFVEGNAQAGMQAFMAGKIKIQGDMTKLMAMQTAAPDEAGKVLQERIQSITE